MLWPAYPLHLKMWKQSDRLLATLLENHLLSFGEIGTSKKTFSTYKLWHMWELESGETSCFSHSGSKQGKDFHEEKAL